MNADERLLQAAWDAKPDSDFVSSVWEFYERKGYITDRQRSTLEDILDEERQP